MQIRLTEKDKGKYNDDQLRLIKDFNERFIGLDDRVRAIERGDRKSIGLEIQNCLDYLDKLEEAKIWNRKMTLAKKTLRVFRKMCGKKLS